MIFETEKNLEFEKTQNRQKKLKIWEWKTAPF